VLLKQNSRGEQHETKKPISPEVAASLEEPKEDLEVQTDGNIKEKSKQLVSSLSNQLLNFRSNDVGWELHKG
jgi:hypothetical protein